MATMENDMAETLITLTSDIVAAHVSNNSVAVDEVPKLIQNIYGALSGLGAPYWQADARALFSGITFNTSRAQMARAVTDSMAFQVHDVFRAMTAQSPVPLGRLYADGGPSRNTFLMQCVADTLDHAVIQCDAPEASALGAAYRAGLSLGVWPDLAAIAALPRAGNRIAPRGRDTPQRLAVWQDAIYRSTVPVPSTMSE